MTYALTFCLDNAVLKKIYPNPKRWKDAYQDIAHILANYGFVSYQSAMYLGLPDVSAVQCVLAAQQLAQSLDWFCPALTDIRMLEINEINDLALAIAPFITPITPQE